MGSLREDPAAARRALNEKQAEVAGLLETGEEPDAPGANDKDSVAGVETLQQQAVVQDVERRRRQELARIDAALARVEAGEYGWCMVCGEPIPEARLELDPAVALCVGCAARR